MLYSGTDPESYITEYTLVYEHQTGQTWPLGRHVGSESNTCLCIHAAGTPRASLGVPATRLQQPHLLTLKLVFPLGVLLFSGYFDLSRAPTPIARAILRVQTVGQVVRTYQSYRGPSLIRKRFPL